MSHYELFAPDPRTGMHRLLRASTQVGVAELLHSQQDRSAVSAPATMVAARDTGA